MHGAVLCVRRDGASEQRGGGETEAGTAFEPAKLCIFRPTGGFEIASRFFGYIGRVFKPLNALAFICLQRYERIVNEHALAGKSASASRKIR